MPKQPTFVTLYQAYAGGFWTNLYRTPQEAADVIRRHYPSERQCIVYDGVFELDLVPTALKVNLTSQHAYFHPTAIYLAGKVSTNGQ